MNSSAKRKVITSVLSNMKKIKNEYGALWQKDAVDDAGRV